MAAVAHKLRGLTASNARAAVWAWQACGRVKRQLREGGLRAVRLPSVPVRCETGTRGAEAVLRRRRLSCLEAALIRQAWLSAHGDPQAVVIGVRGPDEEFGAHAWLESQAAREAPGFVELMRHPAGLVPHR